MQQKLSAMNYIKNNKRKVSVLVVSLTMCFVLFYLAQFLLSVAPETFRVFLVERAEKIQYIYLPAYAFDVDYTGMTNAEIWESVYEEHKKLGKILEENEGIKRVYPVDVAYVTVRAVVGQCSLQVPLLHQGDIDTYLQHLDSRLVKGRMPTEPYELLLDERIMKNGSYHLGDSIENYPNTKIVGIVSGERYFACGMAEKSDDYSFFNYYLCVLSDGSIEDMTAYIRELGYEFKESDASIIDMKTGQHFLQRDVIDSITNSENLIYIAITTILCISILIVYISYLRDRRNEWCFYCSVGFSRKAIYGSVMRELLFTFGLAIFLACVIIGVSVVVLDYVMIQPLGLICRYFYPEVVLENLCAYAVILGILQLPIRYAIHKIQTIDAIDDDLN